MCHEIRYSFSVSTFSQLLAYHNHPRGISLFLNMLNPRKIKSHTIRGKEACPNRHRRDGRPAILTDTSEEKHDIIAEVSENTKESSTG